MTKMKYAWDAVRNAIGLGTDKCHITGQRLNGEYVEVEYAEGSTAKVSYDALRDLGTAKAVALNVIAKAKASVGRTHPHQLIEAYVDLAHQQIVTQSGGLVKLLVA